VKVLLVGSGGREHALAWKLSRAASLEELHAAPGNPGSRRSAAAIRCAPRTAKAARPRGRLEADLVVVGPEAPLVAGVADELRHLGVAVFGPSAGAPDRGLEVVREGRAARAGVPDRRGAVGRTQPVRDQGGRARGGKGVFVCHTQDELDAALGPAPRSATRS
jgi:phosphoribosylamine--glycine ligase